MTCVVTYKGEAMLDIAIIGGGISGLALARRLALEGRNFALFEARGQIGGRVRTVTCSKTGAALDLGPTWYCPETQPTITKLIAELGLSHFRQYDKGSLLTLNDSDKRPTEAPSAGIHDGSERIAGGMAMLCQALAVAIPEGAIDFSHVLVSVEAASDHVVLGFQRGSTVMFVRARRVVLAMPPRLIAEHIRFSPTLSPEMIAAMNSTATWMAAQAKAILTYPGTPWRDKGYSGSAFVTHEQAVLGEVFDASSEHSDSAGALGGFVALSPTLRESFSDGLPMLIGNQIGQLFGAELEQGTQYYQDWATEAYTCSTLDRTAPPAHPEFAPPLLREPHWGGRLYFGGAETASHGNGYLEGAVTAALRIGRDIALSEALEARATSGLNTAPPHTSTNAESLAAFQAWAELQPDAAFQRYRQHLTRALSRQERSQLTQRAILAAVEETCIEALSLVEQLDFDSRGLLVESGRVALTPQIQTRLQGFLPKLIDKAIAFNRTSCALSNFPDEHTIAPDYQQVILKDIAAAWREFLLLANRILIAKGHTIPTPKAMAS